jgi:hypothetical protein
LDKGSDAVKSNFGSKLIMDAIKSTDSINKNNIQKTNAETIEINDVGPENLRIVALKLGAKRSSIDSIDDEHGLSVKQSRA